MGLSVDGYHSHTGTSFDAGLAFHPIASEIGLSGLDAFHENGHFEHARFGHPDADTTTYIHQTTDFTCAVVSQQMILKQFGVDVSEARLVYDATSHGWLTDHGTRPEDISNLLEYYGVKSHTHIGGDIQSIIAELAHGHKVIAAVDSGELWGTDFPFEDWIKPHGADHALVVTGVDFSDPANPRVFVNDPGNPDGAGKAYPLEQFLDAWNDSGRMFVATDDAPLDLGHDTMFGAGYHPGSGMYMDKEFWKDLALRVAGEIAAAAVNTLLSRLLTEDTIGSVPMQTIEHMTDIQRDQLFYLI